MFREDPIYCGADSSWIFICLLCKHRTHRLNAASFLLFSPIVLPHEMANGTELKEQQDNARYERASYNILSFAYFRLGMDETVSVLAG